MAQYSFDNVSIHGFRGLRQLRLENLGRINLLVGENNCGKTSVLEAMSILCRPLEPMEWLSVVRRRDFGRLDETRIQSLRWCFTQHGTLTDPDAMFDGTCEMSCDGRFPLRSLKVTYRDLIRDPDLIAVSRDLAYELAGSDAGHRSGESVQSDSDVQETRRGAEITHAVESVSRLRRTLFEDEPLSIRVWEDEDFTSARARSKEGQIPTETLTPYSYQINSMQLRHQSRHIFEEPQQLVLELVQKFEPEIQNIGIASFRGGRPAIYLNHRRLGPAPLSVFGDALRRVVLLASTMMSLKGGGVLLIDEVETGIHTTALERVFAWLTPLARELDVQVIATTHSLEAVDAVMASVGESVDDLATYRLEQREDKTRVKRIAGDVLHRLRFDRGMDVR